MAAEHTPDVEARLTLYASPAGCPRISVAALEHLEIPYMLRLVRIDRGEQRQDAYRAVNAKMKLPALVVGDALLTETPAILWWLARYRPERRLLPLGEAAWRDVQILSELNWFSSGLHPLVFRIVNPAAVVEDAGAADGVRRRAVAQLGEAFALLRPRLDRQPWLLETWSALDLYLWWIWERATGVAPELKHGRLDALEAHALRVAERPETRRAIAKLDGLRNAG